MEQKQDLRLPHAAGGKSFFGGVWLRRLATIESGRTNPRSAVFLPDTERPALRLDIKISGRHPSVFRFTLNLLPNCQLLLICNTDQTP
jgi:hypothetical protein